jgi:hypothetical protein
MARKIFDFIGWINKRTVLCVKIKILCFIGVEQKIIKEIRKNKEGHL